MHVIWRRPDGFHGASPSDYVVVELSDNSRLWLHKTEKNDFPFRLSGGWEEGDATKRLNNLVNLLPLPKPAWLAYLRTEFDNSMKDDPKQFVSDLNDWLLNLKSSPKGDTWEVQILSQAIDTTIKKMATVVPDFIKKPQGD